MKPIVITIANTSLSINYTNSQRIPPLLNKFQTHRAPKKHSWDLEVLSMPGISKRHPQRLVKDKIASMRQRFLSGDKFSLEAQGIQQYLSNLIAKYPKISLKSICFFFREPVEINLKNNKIRYFYFDEPFSAGNIFYNQLLTFVFSGILAAREGMLLHCTSVVKDKEAYLFFAHSGGGKSTAADLSRKYQVLGDDIVAIRKHKKSFFAYATPWPQRKFIKPNPDLSAKIKAVFFLKKAAGFNLKFMPPEEALIKMLSEQVHFLLYTEPALARKVFFTAAQFFKKVPAYEMGFTKKDNFWPELMRQMR